MTEDDVHVVSIGFTELEALNQKRIDLAMTFLTNEPVQARAMGLQVETLEVSPYYNLISTGLATSDSNVQQRPGPGPALCQCHPARTARHTGRSRRGIHRQPGPHA